VLLGAERLSKLVRLGSHRRGHSDPFRTS